MPTAVMRSIARRSLSTLIPPKVASPKTFGAAPDALRMKQLVNLYERLPRGPAPKFEPKNMVTRYVARYFTDNGSAKPLIHLILFLVAIGYAQHYYFHLRHHKNNAH